MAIQRASYRLQHVVPNRVSYKAQDITYLEPVLEVHEDQGALGVQGVDDSPQRVHSVPAVHCQPAVLQLRWHHGRCARSREASRAAARGCRAPHAFRRQERSSLRSTQACVLTGSRERAKYHGRCACRREASCAASRGCRAPHAFRRQERSSLRSTQACVLPGSRERAKYHGRCSCSREASCAAARGLLCSY